MGRPAPRLEPPTPLPLGERTAARGVERLYKAPSGIAGLDEITHGGLPRGRATLICGGPGSGKTLSAMEFLVRGATQYDEPGVFMAFEETAEELVANVASLGFDLRALEADSKLAIDFVRVERSEIEETGEYDLEGLFVRLQLAIDSVGAKRVVLDTIESLFGGLLNEAILRSEIRRLFRWLKARGQTVVVTAEQGEGSLTRQGLEEYVSDCVIFLDHRVIEQISTRRLRVVKYRGTVHGTNEYPFLIDEDGISILPETSMALDHTVSSRRISSGIPRLDEMLGGRGYYEGSTILVSGTAGTGKTTLAAALARDACAHGSRSLYFTHEESPDQLLRNMQSVGIDLAPFRERGALRICATRPSAYGLEMHLVALHKTVEAFGPDIVLIDPISNLTRMGSRREVTSMLTRLIDFLKTHCITTLMTHLTVGGMEPERTELQVSSLVDTWLVLNIVRSAGERNRTLAVIKSRGMPHSNQASEFILSPDGIQLVDTYLGPSGVLTGSARLAKEAEEAVEAAELSEEIARTQRAREHRRRLADARVAAIREQFAAEDADLSRAIAETTRRLEQRRSEREAMAKSRQAFNTAREAASRKRP